MQVQPVNHFNFILGQHKFLLAILSIWVFEKVYFE